MITEEIAKKRLDELFEQGIALSEVFSLRHLALQGEEEEQQGDAAPDEAGRQAGSEAGAPLQEFDDVGFGFYYQSWYSRALPLLKRLAPDRYAEFQAYYRPERRQDGSDAAYYGIQDHLRRLKPDSDFETAADIVRCFMNQLAILKSVADRVQWMSLDTEDQVARSQQLGQLETARNLMKVNEQAAGALAGTVLEAYLKKLALKHEVKLRKQFPPASEVVEALKEARVFDVPVWSQATWLAEIQGRYFSPESTPPTKAQVRDLVDGTHWLLTNVF